MKMNQNEYTTKDFYLSACILASGIRPTLRRLNDKVFIFVFPNSNNQVEEIIQKHWDRKLNLPTRTLLEAISELKTRIYEGQ